MKKNNGELLTIQKDILLKQWELVQNLAKNSDEQAWKVRMWGLTIWSLLVAYAFEKNNFQIAILSLIILLPIFIFEIGLKIVSYKMIILSHEVEDSLNDLLLNEDIITPPEEGTKINITQTSWQDIKSIFKIKRWLIWGPYLVLAIVNVFIFFILEYK